MKKKVENIFEHGQLILCEDINWGPVQMDDPNNPPCLNTGGYVLRKKITKKQRKRLESICDGTFVKLKEIE